MLPEHKMFNLAISWIFEKTGHVKQKVNSVRFLTCFDPVAGVCVIVRGKGYIFMTTFFESALSV